MELIEKKVEKLKSAILAILKEVYVDAKFPGSVSDLEGDQNAIFFGFLNEIPKSITKKHIAADEIDKEELRQDLKNFIDNKTENINVFKRMEQVLKNPEAKEKLSGKWDYYVAMAGIDVIIDTISVIVALSSEGEKAECNLAERLLFSISHMFRDQLKEHKSVKLGYLGEIAIRDDEVIFNPNPELLQVLDLPVK